MSWTDERIELLRKSWEGGMTASQIAETLGEGVSRNAVIGKAHRLGLQSRPSPVKGAEGAAVAAPAPAVAPAPVTPVAAPAVVASTAPAASVAAPVPAPKPAPRRPSRAVVAKPAKTTLLDLSEKVCKWPIGHPGEVDFHFCGKASKPSFPYCEEHCLVAYQAQMPRRDRSRPPPPIMPGMRR